MCHQNVCSRGLKYFIFYKILLTKCIFIYIYEQPVSILISISGIVVECVDVTKRAGSWESLVWESDYTGCSFCFWLTSWKFMRIIGAGITLHPGSAECFFGSLKRTSSGAFMSRCLFCVVDSCGVAVTLKNWRNLFFFWKKLFRRIWFFFEHQIFR